MLNVFHYCKLPILLSTIRKLDIHININNIFKKKITNLVVNGLPIPITILDSNNQCNLAPQLLSIVSLSLNNQKHGKMNNHLSLMNDQDDVVISF
jgi:hypothetical protein